MKIGGNDLWSGGGNWPCLVDFAGIPIPILFDIAQQRWKHLQPEFCWWSTMRQKSWQYLAGMASSMATIVSIGTLSALYVWAHHGTILSETSSLIEKVLRKYVLSRWHLLMTMEVELSKVRLCDIGVENKILWFCFVPSNFGGKLLSYHSNSYRQCIELPVYIGTFWKDGWQHLLRCYIVPWIVIIGIENLNGWSLA